MKELCIRLTDWEFERMKKLVKDWKNADNIEEVSDIKGDFVDEMNELGLFTDQKAALNIYENKRIEVDF